MDKKRIVVKIGSSSLTNSKGEIDHEKFSDHIRAIAALRAEGHEVLIVSSGAVAAGFKRLGYPSRPVTIKGKQAAAAVGQSLLIQAYMEKFGEFGILPAQILLTRNDFSKKSVIEMHTQQLWSYWNAELCRLLMKTIRFQ